VHSVALGPEQVAHDESQGAHPVSLVAVQAAISYCPGGQAGVQVSHATLPVVSAKVPAAAEHGARQDGWWCPARRAGGGGGARSQPRRS
jgi:hypothetical protein